MKMLQSPETFKPYTKEDFENNFTDILKNRLNLYYKANYKAYPWRINKDNSVNISQNFSKIFLTFYHNILNLNNFDVSSLGKTDKSIFKSVRVRRSNLNHFIPYMLIRPSEVEPKNNHKTFLALDGNLKDNNQIIEKAIKLYESSETENELHTSLYANENWQVEDIEVSLLIADNNNNPYIQIEVNSIKDNGVKVLAVSNMQGIANASLPRVYRERVSRQQKILKIIATVAKLSGFDELAVIKANQIYDYNDPFVVRKSWNQNIEEHQQRLIDLYDNSINQNLPPKQCDMRLINENLYHSYKL